MIDKSLNIRKEIEQIEIIDTISKPLLLPPPQQPDDPKKISPKIKKIREFVEELLLKEGLPDNEIEKESLVDLLNEKRELEGNLTFSDPERKHLNVLLKSFFPYFSEISFKKQIALIETLWDAFKTGMAYHKLNSDSLDGDGKKREEEQESV